MRRVILGLITSLMILPAVSFEQVTTKTQATPQEPSSWIAFQKKENIKRVAFFREIQAERDAFLKANPDVKAYFDQMRAAAKARFAAWRALHPIKSFNNSKLIKPAILKK